MTCCVDQERADVCKSESPLKLLFSTIFFCARSALVPWTDITLKKIKPSSSQFSHCCKRGLIILHVYFILFYCFLEENVILASDYPFPLGEHHPGKLIEDVYKDDLDLRVREQSHSVSRKPFSPGFDFCPNSLIPIPLNLA